MEANRFCFYHDCLPDERWQGFYNVAAAAIRDFAPSVTYFALSQNVRDYYKVLEYVYNDHPEFFYMNHYGCRFHISPGLVKVYFDYDQGRGDAMRRSAEVEAAASRILRECFPDGLECASDLRKEKKIFDWITDHVIYDHDSLKKFRSDARTLGDAWSVYGTLIRRRAVCEGIACAFKLLCDRAGVPSLVVTGDAGERHAWNIVRIDMRYYQVDCTWTLKYNMDLSVPYRRYRYLNLPDEIMLRNHKPEADFLPRCHSLRYNPFKIKGHCCGSDEELIRVINRELCSGQKRFAVMCLYNGPQGPRLQQLLKKISTPNGCTIRLWADDTGSFVGVEAG